MIFSFASSVIPSADRTEERVQGLGSCWGSVTCQPLFYPASPSQATGSSSPAEIYRLPFSERDPCWRNSELLGQKSNVYHHEPNLNGYKRAQTFGMRFCRRREKVLVSPRRFLRDVALIKSPFLFGLNVSQVVLQPIVRHILVFGDQRRPAVGRRRLGAAEGRLR